MIEFILSLIETFLQADINTKAAVATHEKNRIEKEMDELMKQIKEVERQIDKLEKKK